MIAAKKNQRVAYYGGSFDPVHNGHLAIGHTLLEQFELDGLVFIPAFHAPHKVRLTPTSAYDRYAMLCLVTNDEPGFKVSRMEIDVPERPFSVETLSRLNSERPGDEIFFVMGADSWMDIRTWREWERVLSLSNHIVVTRPGVEIAISHVTDDIRSRVVDIRGDMKDPLKQDSNASSTKRIYITDAVNLDISATNIRRKVREGDPTWSSDVPAEVANYVEKYQIYN
jgi:nicotinate-nucleotide adenylyltransferase